MDTRYFRIALDQFAFKTGERPAVHRNGISSGMLTGVTLMRVTFIFISFHLYPPSIGGKRIILASGDR